MVQNFMNLRDLRHNAKLSADEALEALQEILPTAPRTRNGLLKIEARGSSSLPVLRALAEIYSVTLEEAESAGRYKATNRATPGPKKFTDLVKNA